jgi:hypothetical protein
MLNKPIYVLHVLVLSALDFYRLNQEIDTIHGLKIEDIICKQDFFHGAYVFL